MQTINLSRFALNDLQLFSYMVSGIVAGFYLSKYAIGMVDKGYIRKAVLGVSLLAAVLVIDKTLKSLILSIAYVEGILDLSSNYVPFIVGNLLFGCHP